jgi:hypothetical protein
MVRASVCAITRLLMNTSSSVTTIEDVFMSFTLDY